MKDKYNVSSDQEGIKSELRSLRLHINKLIEKGSLGGIKYSSPVIRIGQFSDSEKKYYFKAELGNYSNTEIREFELSEIQTHYEEIKLKLMEAIARIKIAMLPNIHKYFGSFAALRSCSILGSR